MNTNTKVIAVPTEMQDGLKSLRSKHFGHCPGFVLVEVGEGGIDKVSALANQAHEAGGCGTVVNYLKENGVDTVIAAGMGGGPFRGLQNAGIEVLFADQAEHPDVESAINAMLAKQLTPLVLQQLCKGSGDCHRIS